MRTVERERVRVQKYRGLEKAMPGPLLCVFVSVFMTASYTFAIIAFSGNWVVTSHVLAHSAIPPTVMSIA